MSETRLAKLLSAQHLTAVALQEKGKTKIGLAVPGKQGTTDLYLVKGITEARDLHQITRLLDQFVPGILGVLEMNRLACEGASVQRADMSAMLNVLAAESLDLSLEQSGKLRGKRTNRSLAKMGDIKEVMHVVHHEKNDSNWRGKLRPQVERSGGLESLDVRLGQTPEQLAALHAVELVGREYHIDTTENNLFVVQAFANNVKPRLDAAGIKAEQVLSTIIEAEQEREPVKEVLHRASGVAVKPLWRVR